MLTMPTRWPGCARWGGGLQALQDAVQAMAKNADGGYPASRQYRLLCAAAGEQVPAPTPEEAAVEERQRQLWVQPFAVSFLQLAEQVPALADVEERAQRDPESFIRDLSFRESG